MASSFFFFKPSNAAEVIELVHENHSKIIVGGFHPTWNDARLDLLDLIDARFQFLPAKFPSHSSAKRRKWGKRKKMADRKTKQNQTKSNKRIRYNNSNSKHNPDERSAEAVRGGIWWFNPVWFSPSTSAWAPLGLQSEAARKYSFISVFPSVQGCKNSADLSSFWPNESANGNNDSGNKPNNNNNNKKWNKKNSKKNQKRDEGREEGSEGGKIKKGSVGEAKQTAVKYSPRKKGRRIAGGFPVALWSAGNKKWCPGQRWLEFPTELEWFGTGHGR